MNLAIFHQSTFENLKIGTFIESIYPKWKIYELKVYRELCGMTMKNDARIEEELLISLKLT